MEAFLRMLLPSVLPHGKTFEVYPFQGKADLLDKLSSRLRGYARWLPSNYRIFVVVDRDDDDCRALKGVLEQKASESGLPTRSTSLADWKIVNRIAIEELEAWYFGDWSAVRQAYPRASDKTPRKAAFRDPDAIAGGTWEALERILQNAGYYSTGIRKIESARNIGARFQADRCTSRSFAAFRNAVIEAVS